MGDVNAKSLGAGGPGLLYNLRMRHYLFIIAAISAPILFFAFNFQVDFLDDNCHYMNLGRALYSGMGYTRIDMLPHTRENSAAPGFPLILAGLMCITGNPQSYVFFGFFTTLLYWIFLIVLAYLCVRYLEFNRWLTLLFILYLSLNVRVTKFGPMVTTEAPFMLFSLLVIWSFIKYERTNRPIQFWLATLLSTAAVYIKVTSLPFVLACSIWLVSIKRLDRAILYLVVVVGVLGFWLLPASIDSGFGYTKQVFQPEIISEDKMPIVAFFEPYVKNIPHHFVAYTFEYIPDLVFPVLWQYVYTTEPTIWGILVGSAILVITVIGIITGWTSRSLRLLGIVFIVYFLSHLIFFSHGQRYITVVIAEMLILLGLGLWQVIKWVKRMGAVPKVVYSFLLLSMTALAVPPYLKHTRFTAETRRQYFSGEDDWTVARTQGSRYVNEPALARYFDALKWCRYNTPKDAVLVAVQPRTAFFISERYCVSPEFLMPIMETDEVLSHLEEVWEWALKYHATYVVIDSKFKMSIYVVRPAFMKYYECFSLVHETASPKIAVFKIDTAALRSAIRSDRKVRIEKLLREIYTLKSQNKERELANLISGTDRTDSLLNDIIRYLEFYREIGRITTAETLFVSADALFPQSGKLWLNWGIMINKTVAKDVDALIEKTKLAIEAFTNALEYGADSSDCYNNIGITIYSAGDYETALPYFVKAYILDPKNPAKLKNLVTGYAATGKQKEAREILELAMKRTDFGTKFVTTAKELYKALINLEKF